MTKHCHQCGWEYKLSCEPGRSEQCHQCNEDLRVCLNCNHFDARAAYNCRERRAEPVEEKHKGNFCEFFEFARRTFVPKTIFNPRETAAREQLRKLLGD